jgi:small subunit ribosomal protein S12
MKYKPHFKGIVIKLFSINPKKPNSGNRSVALCKLSNNSKIIAYIPGQSHNLSLFSTVLIRHGKKQDCPGIKFKLIRGALDLGPVPNRSISRSKYGTKKNI